MIKNGTIRSVRAQALGIDRRNIYRTSKQETKDQALREEIKKVHKQHPSYGHLRVAWELKINHKRALRVMNKYELIPPRKKIKHWCTKSNEHHHYTNLIKEVKPSRPHHIWCSDVSYIKYHGVFWYLATIEDIFTRQVVGVQVAKRHNSQLILNIIRRACQRFIPQIFHSDQGAEFMAKDCTQYLEDKGVQISVSDTASPWQNGFQESFFGRFKDEFGDFNRFETVGELIEEIYSQVRYYNHERIHTAFKMPPVVFAKSYRHLSS